MTSNVSLNNNSYGNILNIQSSNENQNVIISTEELKKTTLLISFLCRNTYFLTVENQQLQNKVKDLTNQVSELNREKQSLRNDNHQIENSNNYESVDDDVNDINIVDENNHQIEDQKIESGANDQNVKSDSNFKIDASEDNIDHENNDPYKSVDDDVNNNDVQVFEKHSQMNSKKYTVINIVRENNHQLEDQKIESGANDQNDQSDSNSKNDASENKNENIISDKVTTTSSLLDNVTSFISTSIDTIVDLSTPICARVEMLYESTMESALQFLSNCKISDEDLIDIVDLFANISFKFSEGTILANALVETILGIALLILNLNTPITLAVVINAAAYALFITALWDSLMIVSNIHTKVLVNKNREFTLTVIPKLNLYESIITSIKGTNLENFYRGVVDTTFTTTTNFKNWVSA